MKEYLHELLAHDTYIYGYGFNSKKHELYFDVDMIKGCIKKNDNYLFRIYPATIVFKNVWDITLDISTDDDIIVSQVQTVYCGIPKNAEYINCREEYEVNIECLQGNITFKTIGGNIVQKGEEEVLDTLKIGISSKRPISFCLEGKIMEFALTESEHLDCTT